jgi:hypothetical protein
MREWVVLAETDLLDGLTHSMVEHVSQKKPRRAYFTKLFKNQKKSNLTYLLL